MKAGSLRHRVRLYRNTPIRSSTGQQVDKWEQYDTIWAGLEPFTARMRIQASQIIADVTHKGTIRFHKTIAAGHRMIKTDNTLGRDRTFEIVSAIDVGERRREMELMLIETQ